MMMERCGGRMLSAMGDYRKLLVWQKARMLEARVRKLDSIDDAGQLPTHGRELIDETTQLRAMIAALHKRVNAFRSNQKGASRARRPSDSADSR
jgi:hypothetical protein